VCIWDCKHWDLPCNLQKQAVLKQTSVGIKNSKSALNIRRVCLPELHLIMYPLPLSQYT
jgi:hypothetical protein